MSLLEQYRQVSVSDLADRFEVSSLTIRRDLDELEAQGLISRSYGMATLLDPLSTGLSSNQVTAKFKLAQAAAKLIKDGDTVFINTSSTAIKVLEFITAENITIVTNNGVEFTLGWQDKVSDFSYGATANFTYITNKVNKFKGTDKGGMAINGSNLIWEGHSINSQYLLRVDRILQTDEDMQLVQKMIDNAPVDEHGNKVNPFAAFGKPQKGDLLYKDINNDGIIDNNDKEIVSDGPNPKFLFGLNLNAAWKGFDLSALIQGSFGAKVFWKDMAYNTPTVRKGYQLNKEVAEGSWTEGRTDATYPRLLNYEDNINTQMSDFYLQNKSFVKIRNIQLGYTLPKLFTTKMGIERVRIYGSLENFFTFTRYKGFDPEVSGMAYPSMKQAVVGINVSF